MTERPFRHADGASLDQLRPSDRARAARDAGLAGVRNRLRPRYGFYVDHIVDAFGAFLLLGGILATYTLGTFEISFWKFGPTELRILLTVGNIALYVRGPLANVGGSLVLAVSVIRHTRALYRLETLP